MHVNPSGDEVTMYAVMVSPPFEAGGVIVIVALPGEVVDEDAAESDGAPGTVIGTTGTDADEVSEVNAPLFARTVNEYAVPFVNPLTVHPMGGVKGAFTVQVNPPGDEVTTYEVIALPPSLSGATKVTAAFALPATAATDETTVGCVAGVIAEEAGEGPAVPDELLAVDVKV